MITTPGPLPARATRMEIFQLNRCEFLLDQFFYIKQQARIFFTVQGQRVTGGPGATSTADTVHIIFGVVR